MLPASRALRAFFNCIADALFPIPPAEREALALGGEGAYRAFPRAQHPALPEACSVFAYRDERVSRLVWAVKYKKSRGGAAIAAYGLYRMIKYMRRALPGDMRLVVAAMPISAARRRERGYNQCELILEEIEKLRAADSGAPDIYFARGLLVRTRHTSRQTLKSREERLAAMKGAFAVNETAAARLLKEGAMPFVLVIDDVITTGSTIKEALETLRASGFERVAGLSFAH